MEIQPVINNVLEGASKIAVATANAVIATTQWLGRTISVISDVVVQSVRNVIEFVRPYFESLKDFAVQNQNSILTASAGFVAGVAVAMVASSCWNRDDGRGAVRAVAV